MQLRGKNVSNTCYKGVFECLLFSPNSHYTGCVTSWVDTIEPNQAARPGVSQGHLPDSLIATPCSADAALQTSPYIKRTQCMSYTDASIQADSRPWDHLHIARIRHYIES